MKKKQITVALVWAAMMIAAALIMKGQEENYAIFLLLMSGWIATGGLGQASGCFQAECNIIKRLTGKI